MKLKRLNITTENWIKILLASLIMLTIGVSLQSYLAGYHQTPEGMHSQINNYLIFKTSSQHLFHGLDIYTLHPADHYDYYKYSPAFAFFMAPFSLLPDWLGVIAWNLLNLLVLVAGLRSLPSLSTRQTIFILLLGIFELVGSLMNEQSNALMTGLMLLGIANLEKGNPALAMLFLMFSVYIKIFSLVVFMVILFYPKKVQSFFYGILWFLVFAFVPMLATGWNGLIDQYTSWYQLLQMDFDNSVGYSLLGVMHTWFGYNGSRGLVFLLGVLLMVLPLIKLSSYKERSFRYAVFSALLIWVIIFNHKAESPTFIIALTGIGLYFAIQKSGMLNKILIASVLIFSSLVYSDLTPAVWRNELFHPYFIKAVPCILVWAKIIYEVMTNRLQSLKA
ncbi:MAG: DUF2029 domain-containing protein [Bacteroidota bacterium]|nr:MAG: DUF2029 domain-containing protein [Bacteroidota bacterium]